MIVNLMLYFFSTIILVLLGWNLKTKKLFNNEKSLVSVSAQNGILRCWADEMSLS